MMKKFLKTSISIVLTLAICLSMFCGMTFSSVYAAESVDKGENILAGLMPIANYQTYANGSDTWTVGFNGAINEGTFSVFDYGDQYKKHGSIANAEALYNDNGTSLKNMTDGSTATSLQYYHPVSDNTARKTIVVYKLNTFSSVENITVNFSASKTATLKVYAGAERTTLLNNTPQTATTADTAVNAYSFDIDANANYIAVAVEAEDADVIVKFAEIAAYGTELTNAVSGLMPVANYMTDNGGVTDSWTIHYSGDKENLSFNDYGSDKRSDAATADAAYQALGAGSLTYLTDGDTSTTITLSNSVAPRKMVVIYRLNAEYNLKNINITFGNSTGDRAFKVFAGMERGTLLKGEAIGSVGLGGTATATYSFDSDVTARYIAIVLEKDVAAWWFTVAEIEAYGIPGELNIAQNAHPVALYSSELGTTNLGWCGAYVDNVFGDWYGWQEWAVADSEKILNTWSGLKKLTDDNANTSVELRSEVMNKDLVIIYKLDTIYDISKIQLVANSLNGVKIYLSQTRGTIFRSENLVGNFGSGEDATINFAEDKIGNYVGFVFTGKSDEYIGHSIKDIVINGDAINSAVDGDEVIGGATPVNPNASNGAKSFYQYLNNLKNQDAILTGAHLLNPASGTHDGTYGKSTINYNYYTFLEKKYGVSPSIVSGAQDLGVDYYSNAYEDGIVPMFFGLTDFHGEEYGVGNVKYLDAEFWADVDLENIPDELADYYGMYFDYQDLLNNWASFFQELEEKGVDAYIFRPFAEMNVTGFFGNSGSTTALNATKVHFINVWHQMYDYFVNKKGLTGILFAWSPSGTVTAANPNVMDYYPGNDYVDIVAPTIYSVDGTGELPVALQYDEMLATGKPFGISETSPRNFTPDTEKVGDCLKLLESFKTTYKEASFANLWYGSWHAISENDNAEAFINDDYLISIQNQANHNVEMVQAEEKAVLYSDVSLGGTAVKIAAGAYNVAKLGDVAMKSIDLYDGMKITLYGENNEEWVFGKDVADTSAIEFMSFKIETCEEYTTGDIKTDGEINILDLIALKKYLIGMRDASVLACDMNEDGKANATDLTKMRIYLLTN